MLSNILIENNMTYNTKQTIALNLLEKFLDDTERKFYLFGYAGTGKTYTISNFLIDVIKKEKIDKLFICAPTHKALNVISSYFKSFVEKEKLEPDVEYMTFQKLLSYKPVIDGKSGKKIFKANKESKFLINKMKKLIVIDECSMISSDLIRDLNKYISNISLKVIFIGDNAQLPPVHEVVSGIFAEIPKDYKYHIILDETMRTNKKEIFNVYKAIREWNLGDNLIETIVKYHGNKSFKLYHHKNNIIDSTWFKHYIKRIESNNFPTILAWKNYTVNNYNDTIRSYLNKDENVYNTIVGDILVFNNFYYCSDECSFYTSDMVKVVSVKNLKKKLFNWNSLKIESDDAMDIKFDNFLKKLSKVNLEFTVLRLQVEKIYSGTSNIDEKSGMIKVIDKEDQKEYFQSIAALEKHIDDFSKECKSDDHNTELWTAYYNKIIDPYAEVIYGYSMTTHKSQSSTLSDVYIDYRDIMSNPDQNEAKCCLYTAATRAANHLAIII